MLSLRFSPLKVTALCNFCIEPKTSFPVPGRIKPCPLAGDCSSTSTETWRGLPAHTLATWLSVSFYLLGMPLALLLYLVNCPSNLYRKGFHGQNLEPNLCVRSIPCLAHSKPIWVHRVWGSHGSSRSKYSGDRYTSQNPARGAEVWTDTWVRTQHKGLGCGQIWNTMDVLTNILGKVQMST